MVDIEQKTKAIDPGKKRKSFSSFLAKKGNGLHDYVREYDYYGQPVSLNFEGQDEYKTCLGGCVSFILFVIILAYGALKGKEMVNKEGWTLTSQNVLT